MDFTQMKDEELISHLVDFTLQERELTAQIIIYLSELAGRNLFVTAGYASLYDFCRHGLGFSRGKAYKRAKAALLVALFPQLIDYLVRGELTESHLCIVSSKLTQANFDVVVSNVSTMSKRQAMLFMARIDGAGNLWGKEPEINLTIPCTEELLEKIDRAQEIMGIDKRGKSLSILTEEMVELYLHTHDPYLKAQRSMERQEKRETKKRAAEDLCSQSQKEESEKLQPGMIEKVETVPQKEMQLPGMTNKVEPSIEQKKGELQPGMQEGATSCRSIVAGYRLLYNSSNRRLLPMNHLCGAMGRAIAARKVMEIDPGGINARLP
jgi:hypothetical protein